jgi:hypothetical protein
MQPGDFHKTVPYFDSHKSSPNHHILLFNTVEPLITDTVINEHLQ